MEKYYFNGEKAQGVLKVSKNVKIPYGEKIPNNISNEKIKEYLTRELITTVESKTAQIHKLEKEKSAGMDELKEMINELSESNEKLNLKLIELSNGNKILLDRVDELHFKIEKLKEKNEILIKENEELKTGNKKGGKK